jgi:hypothetical protein
MTEIDALVFFLDVLRRQEVVMHVDAPPALDRWRLR